MRYAINLLSVIPLRKEPSHRSEMVSQLLFGEYVELLEGREDFSKVRCLYDDYEGWVLTSQVTEVNEVLPTDLYLGHWCEKLLVNGRYKHVPFGSPLYAAEGPVFFDKSKVEYVLSPSALWQSRTEILDAATLLKIYSLYLDTPYLWGGKSVLGIDCSGFVQQVFKLFCMKLWRDAYQQAEQGVAVNNLEDVRLGDLAFFGNAAGKITHVGILLRSDEIVHASGTVRIDRIDKNGITNVDTGQLTHRLHSIRRVIE